MTKKKPKGKVIGNHPHASSAKLMFGIIVVVLVVLGLITISIQRNSVQIEPKEIPLIQEVVTKPAPSTVMVEPKEDSSTKKIQLESMEKHVETFQVYTYVIVDDITNDISIYRTHYSDFKQLKKVLEGIYPPNTKFELITSKNASFNRVNEKLTYKNKHPEL